MRLLAATTANDGHAGPLLTFVRACAAAGHEVAVAAPASYADRLAPSGFTHMPFADAPPELIGPIMARLPELGFEQANATVVREVFGRIDAQAALPGVADAIAVWRPDLVLREPAELGSLAAAVAAGTPLARVSIGVQEMDRYVTALVHEPLIELGELAGLPGSSLADAAAGETCLSLVPESLDRAGDPDYHDGRVTARFRDSPAPRGTGSTPQSFGDPELPLVYVTFGSVAGALPPFAGVFRAALDAFADDEVRVFMTVGRAVDVEGLGPIPANAHVVPWWPQDEVLRYADVMLGHGGFGTTYGALARGVPQVVAPLFTSDQVANGRHVAAAGFGRTVEPGDDVVGRAAVEVRRVLADPAAGDSARAGAREVAALPPVADAVRLLGALAD